MDGLLKEHESTGHVWFNRWLVPMRWTPLKFVIPLFKAVIFVGWVLCLLPYVVCFAVYATDEASKWNKEKTAKLVTLILIVRTDSHSILLVGK